MLALPILTSVRIDSGLFFDVVNTLQEVENVDVLARSWVFIRDAINDDFIRALSRVLDAHD